MGTQTAYLADVEAILSHQHDNGASLWTTPDKRLMKGAPFTTLESVLYLLATRRYQEILKNLHQHR